MTCLRICCKHTHLIRVCVCDIKLQHVGFSPCPPSSLFLFLSVVLFLQSLMLLYTTSAANQVSGFQPESEPLSSSPSSSPSYVCACCRSADHADVFLPLQWATSRVRCMPAHLSVHTVGSRARLWAAARVWKAENTVTWESYEAENTPVPPQESNTSCELFCFVSTAVQTSARQKHAAQKEVPLKVSLLTQFIITPEHSEKRKSRTIMTQSDGSVFA